MPAGSPSVTARGRAIAAVLSALDQRFAAEPLQILLGLLLEPFGVHRLAGLALAWRIGLGFVLAADRVHFDAEAGDFRRGELAEGDAFERLADLRRHVGRGARDLI